MGKATSMAETFKDFPADNTERFNEQMREFGSDIGTSLRVVFNFNPKGAEPAKPTYHRSKYMPANFDVKDGRGAGETLEEVMKHWTYSNRIDPKLSFS